MKKYIEFLYKFRWIIAIGVPLLVLALASNLKHLEMDGSYRIWFGENSKTLRDYDDFRATFGNDDAVIISFKDENGIFNKKALKSIDNITQKLWQMKYVARVDSLTNYQYVHANPDEPDDVIVEDFIQDIDSADEAYFQDRKNIAVNDSLIVDGFISRDGKTTMITARLVPKVNEGSDKSAEIMKMVEEILAPEIEETGYKYYLNGGPALTQAFVKIGTSDAMTFTPLVIIASMILLFALFRRVSGALIPIGVVVMTFMTVLAVQVLLGYKLNNFTANLPVFVVAIGIADAVHLYIIWLMYKREGESNKDAVLHSVEKNMLPVFLTSLTTAIGFATLTISKVIPVLTLGIATASGAVLAFVISLVWMPAVLLLLKKEVKKEQVIKVKSKKPLGYGAFILRNNKKIILITTLIFTLLAIGLFKVKVDSNTIRYFDKSVDIRKSTEFLMQNLTGPMA
jgi:predicted RND superfamily exporter protein